MGRGECHVYIEEDEKLQEGEHEDVVVNEDSRRDETDNGNKLITTTPTNTDSEQTWETRTKLFHTPRCCSITVVPFISSRTYTSILE